jgi:chlorobactene lauroyltransferase
MRRSFFTIHLLGEEPAVPAESPLLILPNHSSWWDGFFLYLLNLRLWRRVLYLMMLEQQLARHPFFSRLGAYSIDPGRPHSVRQSLLYTRDLLRLEPGAPRLLVLFPQGELLPWQVRPLGYKPGFLGLLQDSDPPVYAVQLGIRIELLQQQRPQVFFEFSKPLRDSNAPGTLQEWDDRHAQLLEQMSRRILAGEEGRILLQGRGSINTRWLRWRRRMDRRNR